MNNDFEILSAFLESVEPEVSGRSAAPVSDQEREQIGRFVRGELNEGDRDELLKTLAGNETALQLLVDALREESQA